MDFNDCTIVCKDNANNCGDRYGYIEEFNTNCVLDFYSLLAKQK